MKVRTRFAPSPTGFMHVGNLRSALYAYLFAKKNKGDFILRIEDTDLEREVEGAIDVIYETLKESGFKIDEGPNEGGKFGPYIQSERKEIYLKYAEELIKKKTAYYCFCTKERLASLKNDNGIARYDKKCLHLSEEEVKENLKNKVPYVIRQNMPTEGVSSFTDLVFGEVSVPNNELEDHILIKSDGLPTYNFANVIDDHLMEISHVMRGNEYLSSTPKYNLLYKAFGWQEPKYVHLTPIMRDETHKLSKRHGDANFIDFTTKGYLPEAIVNYIALLGWSPKGEQELFSLDELISNFSLEGLSKSPSIFDEQKMKWINSEYIKKLSDEDFLKYALPYFEKSVVSGRFDFKLFVPILKSRIQIFSDIIDMVKFVDEFNPLPIENYENQKLKLDGVLAVKVLDSAILGLNDVTFTKESLDEFVKGLAETLGVKSGAVYTALRLGLTSLMVTPGGFSEIGLIFGKEETIRRLKQSLLKLKGKEKENGK